MKILAVADSYTGRDVFEAVLAPLHPAHNARCVEIDERRAFTPSTPSEQSLLEFLGTPDELVELLHDEEVLLVHGAPVTDAVLGAGANLRLVGCARGGPVNVDVRAASERGIIVTCAPGRNADAVADQAIAFMIMLARKFVVAHRMLLESERPSVSTFEGAALLGHDLRGHTLGLVGYGHVGRRVATRARAFGMSVLCYDPALPYPAADGDDGGVERVGDVREMVRRSDFVSLHARATADNENLFDATMFAAMKEGAFFINTARESLVDEAALDAALGSGRLAGAALDVVRNADYAGPNRLLRHENMVITPHIGGATHETLRRGVQMVADEVERLAAGAPLEHVVNREAVARD
jgi:D-3-phosphoglycerate dehydrogenase